MESHLESRPCKVIWKNWLNSAKNYKFDIEEKYMAKVSNRSAKIGIPESRVLLNPIEVKNG